MTEKPAGGADRLTLNDLLPERAIEMRLEAQDRSRRSIGFWSAWKGPESSWTANKRRKTCGQGNPGSTGLGRGLLCSRQDPRAPAYPLWYLDARNRGGLRVPGRSTRSFDLLFVAPRTRAGLHLKVLSTLSRYLREEEHRKQLLEASGPVEIRRLLTGISIR
jgi:hypothetical protein